MTIGGLSSRSRVGGCVEEHLDPHVKIEYVGNSAFACFPEETIHLKFKHDVDFSALGFQCFSVLPLFLVKLAPPKKSQEGLLSQEQFQVCVSSDATTSRQKPRNRWQFMATITVGCKQGIVGQFR